ncbi:ImmA/IrrE family metallo-endopeptidase [Methylophilus flavus]|uniref:ImmA/IrrE family metallo-endopeptidase n=1 Tax=Methylophilus flavus TaxID=640084 RepID=A0ABW3PDD8_9PROT
MVKNIRIEPRSARDITSMIERVHRDLGYVDGKVQLTEVRELLKLDLRYYQLEDPGFQEEIIHKLKVGAKQVIKRPKLLLDVIRKFDLSALFLPDQKRIYIDGSVPDLKKRWYESHEIAHSVIPWHANYMLGDNRSTLSPDCHETIEAEANFGSGLLLFPSTVFTEARLSSELNLGQIRGLAKQFGNTITSTLWRSVENNEEACFSTIGQHPHGIETDKAYIDYFVTSESFERQFPHISALDVWTWKNRYCRKTKTGPLGAAEIEIHDSNGEPHVFYIESFSNGHGVLTLGRWLRPKPIIVSMGSSSVLQ